MRLTPTRWAILAASALCCSAACAAGNPPAVDTERQASPLLWPEVQRLNSPSITNGQRFGALVNVSPTGTRLIVGAPTQGEGGLPGTADTRPGLAFIYDRQPGGLWALSATLRASDRTDWDEFGSSVAVDGDTAVVGATRQRTAGTRAGAVYVFRRQGDGTWTEEQKLLPQDAGPDMYFGQSVGLHGDRLIVGAYKSDQLSNDCGSAYVFERSGSTWTQVRRLLPSELQAFDNFGINVRLWGDHAVVGASRSDVAAADAGAVYVFERNASGVWLLAQRLEASDAAAGDWFGVTVSIHQSRIAVGARNHETIDGPTNAGAAYVFDKVGGSWVESALIRAPDAAADDVFGSNVAVWGDTLVVGAPGDDNVVAQGGSAYFFRLEGGAWAHDREVHPGTPTAGANFGLQVSLSGNQALISSSTWRVPNDASSVEPGAAFVFEGTVGVATGDPCVNGNGGYCLSGFCAEGVCCDAACSGPCESCLSANTGRPTGQCEPIPAGTDPRDECPSDGALACTRDGFCDGSRACRAFAPAGTPCGATTCVSWEQTGRSCNGAGACLDQPVSCGQFQCDSGGTACLTTCTGDDDCQSTGFCSATFACEPKRGNGSTCTRDEECSSGNCVDGVCCNTPCNGQCEACAETGSVGTCVPVSGAPRQGRQACASGAAECAGTCNGVNRSTCTYPGATTSCGTTSCTEGRETGQVCDGSGACVNGSPRSCSPYTCGASACLTRCDQDVQCASGFICESNQCVPTTAGRCSPDRASVLDAAGNFVRDCSPYYCTTGACGQSCSAASDCRLGWVCDRARNACVQATTPPVSVDVGGCAVAGSAPRRGSRSAGALAGALALALLRRRRGANALQG